MNIEKLKKTKSERGFTIVELLIVIVVIGILAAIVIVAYSGIQNQAKMQSSKATASGVQKKIEAYNAANTSYPSATSYADFLTALNGSSASSLQGSNVVLDTPDNTSTNKAGIYRCTAGGTGFSITWYDYSAPTQAAVAPADGLKVNFGGACTTWTELT